jgi:FkbM family methyltransferase
LTEQRCAIEQVRRLNEKIEGDRRVELESAAEEHQVDLTAAVPASASSSFSHTSLRGWSSPLSPGLEYCAANPFLPASPDDPTAFKRLFALENYFIRWHIQRWGRYRTLKESGGLGELSHAKWHMAWPMEEEHLLPCEGGLDRWGAAEDGGKVLCNLKKLKTGTIFSLGSRNDFSFEQSLSAAKVPVNIHVFDCTSEAPEKPIPRLQFHKVCLGNPDSKTFKASFEIEDGVVQSENANVMQVKTYAQIMQQLQLTQVELLKMDIEGFEFEVFDDLVAAGAGDQLAKLERQAGGVHATESSSSLTDSISLPYQLSFETHVWKSDKGKSRFSWFTDMFHKDPPDRMMLMDNFESWNALWKVGYRAVSVEPNIWGPLGCCHELTLVRLFC